MTYEPPKGYSIFNAAIEAIEQAKQKNKQILFIFNGIEVSVDPKSYAGDVCYIYSLKHNIRRLEA